VETAVSGRNCGPAGIPIPAGRGYLGRIVSDRQPVLIEHVEPGELPELSRAPHPRSLLGVPMLAGQDVVGVLQVGSRRSRRFTADDVHLLQLAADRAAQATLAMANRVDRAAALALQRSLLPAQLPEVCGLDLAARYLPGHHTGVGGDWYDVFGLPSGWLGVVIGDVTGHGLRAAVVMGRLRSALRAYALEDDDPASVLTRLDRKIRHFEGGHLATALYAMLPPDRSRIHLSLAGHPPPVLTRPAHPTELLELPVDEPLGLRGCRPRRGTVIDFPPGSVLICYTDGLVERRTESIDTGLERLRTTVAVAPADAICSAVMNGLADGEPSDDIALLMVRRRSAKGHATHRDGRPGNWIMTASADSSDQ
jgi:serine phosphatase RsbU (regulator of sigma subunit)